VNSVNLLRHDPVNTAWLAGLFEGEGWFGMNQRKYPALALYMTDFDVIQRAAGLLEMKIHWNELPSGKIRYGFTVQGKRAVEVMKLLRPQLGGRRHQQIDRVLSA